MINSTIPTPHQGLNQALPMPQPTPPVAPQGPTAGEGTKPGELREAFDQFVGESFYGMLFKTMRQSVGKSAYFHGGRGEEVFQGQLDQMLSEKMSKASASSFSDPMFELFQLGRAR